MKENTSKKIKSSVNCPFPSEHSVSLAWPPKNEEKGQLLQDTTDMYAYR